jgi:hypothetical protein
VKPELLVQQGLQGLKDQLVIKVILAVIQEQLVQQGLLGLLVIKAQQGQLVQQVQLARLVQLAQ